MNLNLGPPICFWVDQKQSSYKVGRRKLKIYCSNKIWICFFLVSLAVTLHETQGRDLPGSLLSSTQGQDLGGVRKEVVALKPSALLVSRKSSGKDAIQASSRSFVLYDQGFLCVSFVLGSFSGDAPSPFRWTR